MTMIDLIDSHCHIHELIGSGRTHQKWYGDGADRTPATVIEAAAQAGVNRMLTVGTSLTDSILAVEFAKGLGNVWVAVGIHPHDTADHNTAITKDSFASLLEDFQDKKVVAIGEIGLDYFYNLSPRHHQIEMLEFQIEQAIEHDLPISFHVREAFDDFWPIFDNFKGIRGVLHSFTDKQPNLDKALERGLLIGVNGIATFTKDASQLELFKNAPLESILLETDAPYLTPAPFRDTMCEPRHIRVTAEFLSQLRSVDLDEIARKTTENAEKLFNL